ncbi:hypothetical protein ANN_05741 [Periplaneta americana]|uniref:Uncharacterized protein n=1 Tax=Periplaneta americana TaxID=6978 RepID=A0ABQ8TBM6_PERAM|nr:hypothetical protein ANN_05741 [Periplaneta americana]
MAGLCEGGNEPPGSLNPAVLHRANPMVREIRNMKLFSVDELKPRCPHLWSNGQRVWPRNQVSRVRIPVGAISIYDRSPLRRHVDVRSAVSWSVLALHGL